MGFCRRCGDIVAGERCKCGGTANAGITNALLQNGRADSWSRNYLAKAPPRSPSPTKSHTPASPRLAAPSTSTPFARPGLPLYHSAPRAASPTLSAGLRSSSPAARGGSRPPSPLKAQHTGGRVQVNADGEELRAFGCVIGKTQWCCASCGSKFRQEETIYPHPDAKVDTSLREMYFCRECFAERFSKGACVACDFAVLADAPFIKHDKRVWHDTCFVCLYCAAPQSDAILDFAGKPSCENCFDTGAYKTRGIPPSPHLASSPFASRTAGAPARPAPSKWGRGSISTPPKLLTLPTRSGVLPVRAAAGGAEAGPAKAPAWRVQAERERSPMVKSFDELGDKMRRLGLEVRPEGEVKGEDKGSPWGTPTSASAEGGKVRLGTGARVPPPSSPLKQSNALPVPFDPTKPSWTAPPSPTKPFPSATSTTPAGQLELGSLLLPRTPEPMKPTLAAGDDACVVCHLDLGYGELVELPNTGALMHKKCFKCKGCGFELSAGKHVNAEGSVYHHDCAPAPKRYRSIVTSIKEDLSQAEMEAAVEMGQPVAMDGDDNPSCAGCDRLIGTAQAVTLPTSERTYHAACFTCAKCRLELAAGSQRSFVEVRGKPFHSACAPARAPSPPVATATSPLRSTTSRTTTQPKLPRSSSQPKIYYSPDRPSQLPSIASFSAVASDTRSTTTASPSASSASSPGALFATRARPPPRLGGLLICSGCSVRATEKETVTGPLGRRWHAKCLKCFDCARGLDSEARVGEDAQVRCEACRRAFARRSGAAIPRKWGVAI